MSLYPKKWGRLVNVCNGSSCPQSLVATPLHLLLVFLWCLLCKVNKYSGLKVTIFTIFHPWFIKINNLALQDWNEVIFLWFIYGKLCIYIVHKDPAAFGALFPQIYDAAAVSYNWLSMFGILKRSKKMRYLQISTIRYPELEKKNLKNEHIIVFLLLNLNMRHR